MTFKDGLDVYVEKQGCIWTFQSLENIDRDLNQIKWSKGWGLIMASSFVVKGLMTFVLSMALWDIK